MIAATCRPTTQWFYSPVSGASLQKMGTFVDLLRDFWGISGPKKFDHGSPETIHELKMPHFAGIFLKENEILQNRLWMAGAGGIEPPNGGIKIRCGQRRSRLAGASGWIPALGPQGAI